MKAEWTGEQNLSVVLPVRSLVARVVLDIATFDARVILVFIHVLGSGPNGLHLVVDRTFVFLDFKV